MIMKTTCRYCKKEYDTVRDSSIYCSNSCRTGAYKWRKKIKQDFIDRQIAIAAQKEIEDNQKLIDAELRKQKAEKRRIAKEDKPLMAVSENASNSEDMAQQDAPTTDPEVQTESEQNQAETLQPKEDTTVYSRTSIARRKPVPANSSSINWVDSLLRIAKAMADNYIK